MKGFVDIHSHFLYGMDDGARSKIEMEAMLDAAYADGIVSLFATPHAIPGVYPLDHTLLVHRLNEAHSYCRANGYHMNIYGGAEVLYTSAIERFAIEGMLPTLSDSSNVLLEFVPDIAFGELKAAVDMLMRSGYRIILAHAERYNCLFHRSNIYRLKDEYGVQYQMNCGSVLKDKGLIKRHHMNLWLKHEIIDFIATDSHDTNKRPSRMRDAYTILRQKYRETYVDRLFGLGHSSTLECEQRDILNGIRFQP